MSFKRIWMIETGKVVSRRAMFIKNSIFVIVEFILSVLVVLVLDLVARVLTDISSMSRLILTSLSDCLGVIRCWNFFRVMTT